MSKLAPLRRSIAAAILALIWLAMLTGGTGALDRRSLQTIYAGGHPGLLAAARVFTFLGEPTMLVGLGIVAAAWLWWRHHARYALTVVVVTLIGRGLAEVQKYAIGRPRPQLEPHLVVTRTPSFPSGHATSSMIVYLTLALVLTTNQHSRRLATAGALLLSLLIGLSRVMLGVHWPSDVVAGWSFGALWVLLALRRPAVDRARFPTARE